MFDGDKLFGMFEEFGKKVQDSVEETIDSFADVVEGKSFPTELGTEIMDC